MRSVNQDDTEKLKLHNLALNQLQRGDVQLSRQSNTSIKFTGGQQYYGFLHSVLVHASNHFY